MRYQCAELSKITLATTTVGVADCVSQLKQPKVHCTYIYIRVQGFIQGSGKLGSLPPPPPKLKILYETLHMYSTYILCSHVHVHVQCHVHDAGFQGSGLFIRGGGAKGLSE